MQSSLVQVPCKSGSPQGVFGGAQVLAEETAGAAALFAGGAGAFWACRLTVAVRMAADMRIGYFISNLLTTSRYWSPLLRLRGSSLLDRTRAAERIEHRIVPFMTRVFKIGIALLLSYRETDLPRFGVGL